MADRHAYADEQGERGTGLGRDDERDRKREYDRESQAGRQKKLERDRLSMRGY